MGQIFRRIKNIIKSYNSETDYKQTYIDVADENEELKRIIEELNKEKKSGENYSGKKSFDTQKEITESEAYSILGLNRYVSNVDIKKVYREKIRQYHPDKVESLGDELKEVAARKTLEINNAFELLKKLRGF